MPNIFTLLLKVQSRLVGLVQNGVNLDDIVNNNHLDLSRGEAAAIIVLYRLSRVRNIENFDN